MKYSQVISGLLLGFIILVSRSIYYLSDTERAISVKPKQMISHVEYEPIIQMPGLHFQIPFLEKIIRWDTRIQHVRLRSLIQTVYAEIWFDYRINYRIVNLNQYLQWLINTRIDLKLLFSEWLNEYLQENMDKISTDDLGIYSLDSLKKHLLTQAKKIGLEILEINILQKTPSQKSKKNILKQMKQKYLKLSQDIEKESQINIQTYQSEEKAKQTKVLGEAQIKAAQIKSKGDAQAMEIYHQTYSQNPEFAAVYQKLVAHEQISV